MLLAPLPDDARAWLFSSSRVLSDIEQEAALAQTRSFLSEWTSHGRLVPGEAEFLHQRVLVVGGHLAENDLNAGVSGCGIDSLTNALESITAKIGFGWTGPLEVLYYNDDSVLQTVSRSEFRRLAEEGSVTSETLVLDLTPALVGELRANGIKLRVADSWHGSLLGLGQPA